MVCFAHVSGVFSLQSGVFCPHLMYTMGKNHRLVGDYRIPFILDFACAAPALVDRFLSTGAIFFFFLGTLLGSSSNETLCLSNLGTFFIRDLG